MPRRWKKWTRPLVTWTLAVGVVWVIQLVTLGWFFRDVGWSDYWWWRRLYRPGLRVFSWTFHGLLPPYFFSPIDKTGALCGFTFAALVYATVFGSVVLIARKFWKSPRRRPTRRKIRRSFTH